MGSATTHKVSDPTREAARAECGSDAPEEEEEEAATATAVVEGVGGRGGGGLEARGVVPCHGRLRAPRTTPGVAASEKGVAVDDAAIAAAALVRLLRGWALMIDLVRGVGAPSRTHGAVVRGAVGWGETEEKAPPPRGDNAREGSVVTVDDWRFEMGSADRCEGMCVRGSCKTRYTVASSWTRRCTNTPSTRTLLP